jgi:myo-inositol-1(or 4)-monophosphatase
MPASDISVFLDAAVGAVRAAGAVALERQRDLGPARQKGSKDIVTEADIECDRLIRSLLLGQFPDHSLLTEEEGVLDQDSDYRWIVDPIDGTINYAHGIPLWGVSVGLSHRGKMLCGAIYLPVQDELFTAVAGGGAFLNAAPIHVSSVTDPHAVVVYHADLNVGQGEAVRHKLNADILLAQSRCLEVAQRVRCLGSAVVEGSGVASGRIDAYWMADLKAWDVAVTTLLVAEAGGRVTDMRGNPWTLESADALFTNGVLHDTLVSALDWANRGK